MGEVTAQQGRARPAEAGHAAELDQAIERRFGPRREERAPDPIEQVGLDRAGRARERLARGVRRRLDPPRREQRARPHRRGLGPAERAEPLQRLLGPPRPQELPGVPRRRRRLAAEDRSLQPPGRLVHSGPGRRDRRTTHAGLMASGGRQS